METCWMQTSCTCQRGALYCSTSKHQSSLVLCRTLPIFLKSHSWRSYTWRLISKQWLVINQARKRCIAFCSRRAFHTTATSTHILAFSLSHTHTSCFAASRCKPSRSQLAQHPEALNAELEERGRFKECDAVFWSASSSLGCKSTCKHLILCCSLPSFCPAVLCVLGERVEFVGAVLCKFPKNIGLFCQRALQKWELICKSDLQC